MVVHQHIKEMIHSETADQLDVAYDKASDALIELFIDLLKSMSNSPEVFSEELLKLIAKLHTK